MKRYALLIQGPLISKGVPGANLHLATGPNLEKYKVNFDCRDNIRKMISKYKNHFDEIVISTWDNEINEDESFSDAKIVVSPDPGTLSYQWDGKPNNKYRQFFGIHCGLMYLKKIEFDGIVLKIRTDNFLEIDSILSFFESLDLNTQTEKIGVPISIPGRCYIQEFYLIGSLEKLLAFSKAQIEYSEFTESVHNETILKYAFAEFRNDINERTESYFPAYFKPFAYSGTLNISSYMGKHAFYALPDKIFFNQIQRGSKISSAFQKKLVRSRKPILRETSTIIISCNLSKHDKVLSQLKYPNNRNQQLITRVVNALTISVIQVLHVWYYRTRKILR